MQNAQFIELIRKPESIQKEDLSRLDNLCKEHPYCSSLHKLRLKALKEADSEAYNKELKMTAAISGNRTILFEYITQKSFQAPIKELVKQVKQKPEETVSKSVNEDAEENEDTPKNTSADDDNTTESTEENVTLKQQNYPNSFGLTFVVEENVDTEKSLEITFEARYYNPIK